MCNFDTLRFWYEACDPRYRDRKYHDEVDYDLFDIELDTKLLAKWSKHHERSKQFNKNEEEQRHVQHSNCYKIFLWIILIVVVKVF